jgi:hypothetical protein
MALLAHAAPRRVRALPCFTQGRVVKVLGRLSSAAW